MITMDWDPEVDAPATIAVIGGGPVGIEAAIYARFLGYFVSIFEERRVAHRMLDWHERPLAVPVSQCTTPLGHAAILAQNPDIVRRSAEDFFTGKSYAEEYLLPLAKTDLLFDDIHFLSPVHDVSRRCLLATDDVAAQERANDEFRILVNGRHRGPWTARADIVIDCRGTFQRLAGFGPGGGLSIGETDLKDSFLKHSPKDRKFELRSIANRRVCVVGGSCFAAQFVKEFIEVVGAQQTTKLIWVVPMEFASDSSAEEVFISLNQSEPTNVSIQRALGVEQIQLCENKSYSLSLLQEDDTLVTVECDVIYPATDGRTASLSRECDERVLVSNKHSFVTHEPGFYRLRTRAGELGAGIGLSDAFQDIRSLFAMIAGRSDLDLYSIMEQQQAK